jgi:hypothetical protein
MGKVEEFDSAVDNGKADGTNGVNAACDYAI